MEAHSRYINAKDEKLGMIKQKIVRDSRNDMILISELWSNQKILVRVIRGLNSDKLKPKL